jgi:SAM-dependent methyltransferase
MTSYIGSELQLFSKATNWKAYYGRVIKKYLAGDVLEVGAGIGSGTRVLCDGSQRRWVCLEPDPGMSAAIQRQIDDGSLPGCCEARNGTVADLTGADRFDAIVYIDVLEHIENDGDELSKAADLLKESGHLVILSPAHQWLYTPFDREIGHYRRYSKKSLLKVIPPRLRCVNLSYLDSVGMLASIGNRLLLKSSMPTEGQIGLWDKRLVPLSIFIDPLLGRRLGKSILGVWRRSP